MSPTLPTAHLSLPALPGLELQAKIGEGGMGVVYRALHVTLQRVVAVKVLQPQPEARVSWTREAQTLAALAHPNIVTIHDAGEVAEQRYLVMEYLDGGDLRSRMKRGELWSLAAVRALLEQIATALSFIHGQSVLHLDLKPENILFTKDGQLKLADFGLAHPDQDASLFESGRFVGSLDYIAPEYRAGLTIDSRYDVFALATILYELLTGRLPGRVFVPASQRNRLIPPSLDSVLQRALRRDPAERYPTVEALRKAFFDASGQKPRWATPVKAAAACLLCAGLMLGVYWAIRPPHAKTDAPEPAPGKTPSVANGRGPERVWMLCEQAGDADFVCPLEQARTFADKVETLAITNLHGPVPAEIPLVKWPTLLPMMVVQAPRQWGFVFPLADMTLGRHVLEYWSKINSYVLPPGKNLVAAGNFEGDCLVERSDSSRWRLPSNKEGWNKERNIAIENDPTEANNPTLCLRNLDPAQVSQTLGCYQALPQGLPPSSRAVLRFRARSLNGSGALSVATGMPITIPDDQTLVAQRLRERTKPLPPHPDNPNAVSYSVAMRVVPSTEWQTYVLLWDVPPYESQALHRNLMIDVVSQIKDAGDQVWVDDVELFVWPWGVS